MDIIIQSLGFKASSELENFIQEKVSNLDGRGENIIRANVTLSEGANGEPENCYCEISLEVPGNNHFVKKHADSYEKAIAETVKSMQQTIRKAHDKLIDHRHAG